VEKFAHLFSSVQKRVRPYHGTRSENVSEFLCVFSPPSCITYPFRCEFRLSFYIYFSFLRNSHYCRNNRTEIAVIVVKATGRRLIKLVPSVCIYTCIEPRVRSTQATIARHSFHGKSKSNVIFVLIAAPR